MGEIDNWLQANLPAEEAIRCQSDGQPFSDAKIELLIKVAPIFYALLEITFYNDFRL